MKILNLLATGLLMLSSVEAMNQKNDENKDPNKQGVQHRVVQNVQYTLKGVPQYVFLLNQTNGWLILNNMIVVPEISFSSGSHNGLPFMKAPLEISADMSDNDIVSALKNAFEREVIVTK